jgi:putative ABC transport system ATP-binding protein
MTTIPPNPQATATPDGVLLECKDLKKTFTLRRREIRVLQGVNLSAARGEIVLITGRTGSGKSTFLTLLAGLDRPTAGSVRLDGRRMETLSNEELTRLRRERIGIVFQSHNLLPSWTAFENVEAALLHTGMPAAQRRGRVEALLSELGLGDRMDNLPAELSVGQQQLVAIARALANEPALILADEPTGDVDPESAQEIIRRLTLPVKEKGATLVIASHGTFPVDVADRVLCMSDGRLVPYEADVPLRLRPVSRAGDLQ